MRRVTHERYISEPMGERDLARRYVGLNLSQQIGVNVKNTLKPHYFNYRMPPTVYGPPASVYRHSPG